MTEPASHETNTTGNRHIGDADFRERHYVDPGPYLPPWMQRDAFTRPARTYADETIEEVLDPGYVASISVGGLEPGETEFSWGRGNQNSLTKGPGPNAVEEMKAIMRTNPADSNDNHVNHYTDPGWVMEP